MWFSRPRRVALFRGDHWWFEAESFIRQFATTPQGRNRLESPPVAPVELLQLEVSPCAGRNLHMTVRVYGEDGYTTDYQVVVWDKVAKQGMVLTKIEPIAKKKTTGMEIPDYQVKGGTKLLVGQERFKVCITAYHLFLKQFKNGRPKLSYAKARKSAGIAWRKLSHTEKMEFIKMAAETVNQKEEARGGLVMQYYNE